MQVEFRDVCLLRKGAPILSGVTFSTGTTPVFVVFGSSGAGKTSLLRLINRLEEASSGTVFVDGRPVSDFVPTRLRKTVGMIFQEPRLFDGTVEDNMAVPLRYHQLEADVGTLLQRVGLDGMAGRNVRDLSGGERQRLSIARALVVRPSILLLDEPTSSLDEPAAIRIEALLRDLVEGSSLRAVFVTHNRDQIRRLGARGIVLSKGEVIHQGDLTAYLSSLDAA